MIRIEELRIQRATTDAQIASEERREADAYRERVRKAGEAQDQQWSALYPDGRLPH